MADKTRYVVASAAVVLPLANHSEQYLYQGAPIVAGAYTAEGIAHALENGLIEVAPDEVDHAAAGAEARAAAEATTASLAPAESWSHEQLDGYARDRSYEPLHGTKAEKVAALAELDKAAAAAAAAEQ
jgi:AAA+ superfamily predicted ATPase